MSDVHLENDCMDAPDSQAELVFIVGLPRTGSKLIKVILHKARDACCRISAETWFFGDLFRSGIRKKIAKLGDMSADRNVDRLVNYLFSAQFSRSYWDLVARKESGFNKQEFKQRILLTDRSDKAIYHSIMESFARRDPTWLAAQRRVIGDKTPGHLYYVPQIIDWYPQARIVHTFRDPRAIVASELKKIVGKAGQRGRFSIRKSCLTTLVVMYITVTWLYARRLHYKYAARYERNYYLSKYEDVVSAPEENIPPLCDFLGLEHNEDMLSPRQADSSYARGEKPDGFNVTSLDRWRDSLSPWIQRWFAFWTGRYLAEFGYRL